MYKYQACFLRAVEWEVMSWECIEKEEAMWRGVGLRMGRGIDGEEGIESQQ